MDEGSMRGVQTQLESWMKLESSGTISQSSSATHLGLTWALQENCTSYAARYSTHIVRNFI